MNTAQRAKVDDARGCTFCDVTEGGCPPEAKPTPMTREQVEEWCCEASRQLQYFSTYKHDEELERAVNKWNEGAAACWRL